MTKNICFQSVEEWGWRGSISLSLPALKLNFAMGLGAVDWLDIAPGQQSGWICHSVSTLKRCSQTPPEVGDRQKHSLSSVLSARRMQTLLTAKIWEVCFLLPLSFRFGINDLNRMTIALTGLMDREFPQGLQSGLILTLMGFLFNRNCLFVSVCYGVGPHVL